MELNQQDLQYFVEFVLLDELKRKPAGKRQTRPLVGFWSQTNGKKGLRKSDRRERINVCIEALRKISGLSVSDAAIEVAKILDETLSNQVDVIRTGYYSCAHADYRNHYRHFVSWREWVLKANADTIEHSVRAFAKEIGPNRAMKLKSLFDRLRLDPIQAKRQRDWELTGAEGQLQRIREGIWDKYPQAWRPQASDLWSLGDIYQTVGYWRSAKGCYERALAIWQEFGSDSPEDERVEATTVLQRKLGSLRQAA